MLQSISTALCTVNGELCSDDQLLTPGEKPGKSSHAASKSTQTFKIDIFTEEVTHFGQDSKSGRPKCSIGSAKSAIFKANRIILLKKCLDAHLTKRLLQCNISHHFALIHLTNLNIVMYYAIMMSQAQEIK